jgi:hypothetical protein
VQIQAAQDLFEIVAPSNSEVRIREIKIGQYTDFGDAKADRRQATRRRDLAAR